MSTGAGADTRRAAIAGVGWSTLERRSGQTLLSMARAATKRAIDDAGLDPSDVDGLATFMVTTDSVPTQAVATALALPDVRFAVDARLGGQAPCYLVGLAAMAIAAGQARNVLVFRATQGQRSARAAVQAEPPAWPPPPPPLPTNGKSSTPPSMYPVGYDAYLMYVAMWARRFLLETGQREEDLAGVVLAQRALAVANDRAIRRDPLTLGDYRESPYVIEPFRADDCTPEVDGACAVLVTSIEQARQLRHPPAVVAASAYRAGARPRLDIGDHLLWDDYTRNYLHLLRDELFRRGGVGPGDVDFAEIYDPFSSAVLMGLEGLGFCGRGESGQFVRAGETGRHGRLPTNTNGGMLAEGYVHGMNTVVEAVLQLQGRAGDRQVADHEVGAVSSGALMDGSALILTADR